MGFSTELGILQSKRLNNMNQHTPTHWRGLRKQRLYFLFVCFTRTLVKSIIHTYCNNLNISDYRKIRKKKKKHGSVVKNLSANARDMGLIHGSGRYLRERNSNPLQYSCLGNPMDRRSQQASVHGAAKDSDMT